MTTTYRDASHFHFSHTGGLDNLLHRPPLPCHIHFPLHNSVWPLSAPFTKTACVRLQPRTSIPGPPSGQLPRPTPYNCIHHFSPPSNRSRNVRILTILVKTTSYAISYWNGYEKLQKVKTLSTLKTISKRMPHSWMVQELCTFREVTFS